MTLTVIASQLLAIGGVRNKNAGYYSLYWINHCLKKGFANSSTLLARKDARFGCITLKWWRTSAFNASRIETSGDFSAVAETTAGGVSDLWTPPGPSGAPLLLVYNAAARRGHQPDSCLPKLPLKPRPSQPVLTRPATTMTTSPSNGGAAARPP